MTTQNAAMGAAPRSSIACRSRQGPWNIFCIWMFLGKHQTLNGSNQGAHEVILWFILSLPSATFHTHTHTHTHQKTLEPKVYSLMVWEMSEHTQGQGQWRYQFELIPAIHGRHIKSNENQWVELNIQMNTNIYIYICIYIYIYIYVYGSLYIYICVYMYMYIFYPFVMYIYICVNMYRYVYVYVYVYVYI